MRVSAITSSYVKMSKTNSTKNNNVNFGANPGYNRAFQFASAHKFSRSSYGIKTTVTNMFERLLNATTGFSRSTKSADCNEVINAAKRVGIKRLSDIAYDIGLERNESRDLIVEKGEVVVGIHNLGPYSKGLFSSTDHDQVVLEFRDPQTGRFVGFSRDSENGIAVTTNDERYEFYDNGGTYAFKSLSRQGYQPDAYVDYVGEDGEEPKRSFWDWF